MKDKSKPSLNSLFSPWMLRASKGEKHFGLDAVQEVHTFTSSNNSVSVTGMRQPN